MYSRASEFSSRAKLSLAVFGRKKTFNCQLDIDLMQFLLMLRSFAQ